MAWWLQFWLFSSESTDQIYCMQFKQ